MENQKYDPDIFDPIVVKQSPGKWSLIIPVCLMGIITFLYSKAMLFGAITRAYQPGNWVGEAGIMNGAAELAGVTFCLIISLAIALISRRSILTIGLVTWFGGLTFVTNNLITRNPPSVRFKAEINSYKNAIATQTPFGDQYVEESNGRKLTYWRWITYGIDNAVGVIYDPADKLDQENDFRAFKEPSHGVLFQIQKMEPHWYFVEHS